MEPTNKKAYIIPEMEVILVDVQDNVLEGSAWTEDFEEIEFNWSAAKKGRQIDLADMAEDMDEAEDSINPITTLYTPYKIEW